MLRIFYYIKFYKRFSGYPRFVYFYFLLPFSLSLTCEKDIRISFPLCLLYTGFSSLVFTVMFSAMVRNFFPCILCKRLSVVFSFISISMIYVYYFNINSSKFIYASYEKCLPYTTVRNNPKQRCSFLDCHLIEWQII